MGSDNPELKPFFIFFHVFVTLREDRPSTDRAWFNANDLIHNTDRFWYVIVHICLIAVSNERLDLLRQDWASDAATLHNINCCSI